MPGRVPVLGQDHIAENGAYAIDDGNDLVAAGYAERAVWTEIILNIDGNQCVLVCWLYNGHPLFRQGALASSQRSLKATEKPLRMRISMHCPLCFSMERQAR